VPGHTRRFETERTRRFRQSGLSERDERTISNVETFGCEVVQVKRNSAGPGWSYTLGVHDTCGQPEVITRIELLRHNPRHNYSIQLFPQLYLPEMNGGRDRTRTCDLLRVKPEVPFFYFFQFHSVFCVFNHLGSLLSLKQVTLEVSSDGVLIRF
jgi:hypothetical protein